MKKMINNGLISFLLLGAGSLVASSEIVNSEVAPNAVVEADSSAVTLAVLIDGCAGDLTAFESNFDLVQADISADVSKDDVKASYETLCAASQKTVDMAFFDSAFSKFTEKKNALKNAVENTSSETKE